MKATFAIASTLVGLAAAQGVTEKISPTASAPAGCTGSYSGEFEISVVQVAQAAKRDAMPAQKRAQCGGNGILVMTMKDGVVLDAQKRTGYIAANYQFQFDAPAQTGAIFTAGFSMCGNGSLALGGSNTFYQCKSGTFYNLYDRSWAEQCEPVQIVALPCGGADPVSQVADGQVVGTTVALTTMVTALADGQPQVITTTVPIPVCQINDGQVQGHTTPCASITIVPPKPSTTAVPVSQSSDGQIQVTSPAVIPPAPSTIIATTPVATPGSSAPAPSAPATTAKPSTSASSTLVTSKPSSSVIATTSSTTPATTSTVPASGSSRVAGSFGALAFGLLVAFVCL